MNSPVVIKRVDYTADTTGVAEMGAMNQATEDLPTYLAKAMVDTTTALSSFTSTYGLLKYGWWGST
jgi:uncharacterized membrane protein YqgA involved in biofilm formation